MIKVIQWGTGMVGRQCLREILRSPELELVGLFVYSEMNDGVDAGTFVGLPKTGIRATRDLEKILATPCDIVLHTPKIEPDPVRRDAPMMRLLEAGKTVITVQDFLYPWAAGNEYAERIENICKRTGAKLFGTGLNPGFVLERMALLASGAAIEIDNMTVIARFDASETPSEQTVVDVSGFGLPVENFDPAGPLAQQMKNVYLQSMRFVEWQMGVRFERIEDDHSVWIAEQDEQVPGTFIRKGTVSGVQWRWHCIVDGRRFLTYIMRWIGSKKISHPDWQIRDLWTAEITGKPGLRISFEYKAAEAEPGTGVTPHVLACYQGVAAFALRAIPEVLAAPPGIVLPTSFGHYRASYNAVPRDIRAVE